MALKLTGSPEDALDVSQETFLKAYRNLSAFRFESRFSAWLYRLAYNASMDFLRKNRDNNVYSLSVESEDEEDATLDIPDSAPTPEESLVESDTRRAVREAVMKLSEDKREIIVMREFSGMSYGEIAVQLGIEEGTVKSRLSRARQSLAEILIESGTFPQKAPSNSRKGGKAV